MSETAFGTSGWRGTQPGVLDGADAAARRETRAGWPWLFAAGGAAATAIPVAPGLALAAVGHTQAIPLLISSGVIGLVSVIAGAMVKMHDSTQYDGPIRTEAATLARGRKRLSHRRTLLARLPGR